MCVVLKQKFSIGEREKGGGWQNRTTAAEQRSVVVTIVVTIVTLSFAFCRRSFRCSGVSLRRSSSVKMTLKSDLMGPGGAICFKLTVMPPPITRDKRLMVTQPPERRMMKKQKQISRRRIRRRRRK